jgi:23S rRNA pseudouridine2605 synthase
MTRSDGESENRNPQLAIGNRQQTTNTKTTNYKLQTANSSFSEMPLNKFIAHCGVGSRRDAIPLIKEGKISVNGNVIAEPGFKVTDKDVVVFNGKKLFVTKNMVYILLNKPKDYITTTDDPQGRKTVLQLIKHATDERIYPVGRLDRNTSGVLLFTNDGELTQRLTHPSYNIKKVYEVKLDKPVTKAHFDKIVSGIMLEDGEIHADALAYADSNDRSVIGIEIHSGRNRIVRRIFEHFGYDVKALDRVMYAGLTKKNVERGKWRYLSEKEIRLLKYMNTKQKAPGAKEQA